MRPLRIEGATRTMGAPGDMQGHCSALSISDIPTEDGNFMVSAWELTPNEVEALKNGEPLYLWIRGTSHPVVALKVGT